MRTLADVGDTFTTTAGTMSSCGDRLRPSLVTVGFDVVPLRDDVRLVAAIAAALVDHAQAAIDGAIGRALQPDVDAGLHGQAALVERLRAVFLLEVLCELPR